MDNAALDQYYQEKSAKKRKEMLESFLEQEPGEENQLRKEIFDLRYGGKSHRKDVELPDGYIGLWVNMKISLENSRGFFGVRSVRRDISRQLDRLGITRFMEMGAKARELLYEEFYHMAVLYIDSCLSDRNYTSAVMGLVHMSNDQVLRKLTEDVYGVACELPERLNMREQMSLFSKAVLDAFNQLLPEGRELMEELIAQDQK